LLFATLLGPEMGLHLSKISLVSAWRVLLQHSTFYEEEEEEEKEEEEVVVGR